MNLEELEKNMRDEKLTKAELTRVIEEVLNRNEPKWDEENKNYLVDLLEKLKEESKNEPVPIPKTRQPKKTISPKDKVTNLFFDNEIEIGELEEIGTEGKKSKKLLTAKVHIAHDQLENVSISRELSAYDREVHDAIVSLYIDGENEHITPLMIYRTMTGNAKAKLTPKAATEISNSMEKMLSTRITIDASDEMKAWGMDKAIYEGRVLFFDKITGVHSGKTSEWIRILRAPILMEYATSKKQIATYDIKLLDTPVSKNKGSIELQSYIFKKIDAMKNNPKMNRNIRFTSNKDTEGLYERFDMERYANPSKESAKMRESVFSMLDYWKQEGHIKGYRKNKKGSGKTSKIESVSIIL